MIDVPESFAQRRIKVSGDSGGAWIASLPQLVEDACKQWRLAIDGNCLTGEVGLAVPVRRDDEPLFLKVSWPDKDSAFESFALQHWNGNGAVKLLESDEEHWVMLMERLDSSRTLLSVDVSAAITEIASLLRTLAIPSPAGPPIQREIANDIGAELQQRHLESESSIPGHFVKLALDLINDSDPVDGLLINTDLHYGNVLAGTRAPWLVIDPKVVIGSPEFGIAPMIWNLRKHFESTSPKDFLAQIVAAGDFSMKEALRWTIVRTADYWDWAIETGLTQDPLMCRQILESLAS